MHTLFECVSFSSVFAASHRQLLLKWCSLLLLGNTIVKLWTNITLRWAMIFLTLFITTGGILLGGLLHSYTIDTEMDYDRRYWIWRHYGTASRAACALPAAFVSF